jgi:hypothetical protein
MKKIMAFITGVCEFRSDFTTGYDDYDLLCVYDQGRELAHRLTLRKWDW